MIPSFNLSGQLSSLSADVPSYCLSKLTLNGATIMLAEALQDKGIVVNAFDPGWVKTDMVRDDGYDAILHNRVDSLSLSDRSEELLDWLEDYGVDDAWKLAEPLAVGGIEVDTLNKLMERWRNDPTEMRDMGLHWLALSFDVMTMIASGLRGAKRMSELVGAMKSYSYMDRGVQQLIDIHEGLEDTLRLFAHKLKQGIEIRRVYDCKHPLVLAYGKPFFTTKPVGKGSGLGLETARRVVENRHRGTLTFESMPGKTQFTVCLPISFNETG